MAKRCDVCGKGPQIGQKISHANNKSSKRWTVNLQRVRIMTGGGAKRARVCTQCIRSGSVQKAPRGYRIPLIKAKQAA